MPSRISTKRIATPEVQGDDSYIVIIVPKMGAMRAHREKLSEIEDEIIALKEANADKAVIEARENTLTREGEQMFIQYVKEWNWVDDEGAPLPQPDTDGVWDLLTTIETNCIMDALTNTMQLSGEKKPPIALR